MAKADKNPELWVVNKTSNLVTISIDVNGKTKAVKIPKTWVPIDLSLQIPTSYVKNSPDFRRALTLGLIEEMDSEKVKIFFANDSEAKEELKKVTGSSVVNSILTAPSDKNQIIDTNKVSSSTEILIAKVFGTSPNESSVNNEIRILINSSKINDEELLAITEKAQELGYTKTLSLIKDISAKV